MSKIIFDLDGTLIDSSERMYRLFQKLVPESKLTKEQYWELKRNKVNHKMLLENYFPDVNFETFNRQWLAEIEDREYLDTDQCYPDTVNVLWSFRCLKRFTALIMLTARQSETELNYELNRLKIRQYFDFVLTTANKCSKEDLLKEIFEEKSADDWFISDMGKDILLGKEYDYHTAVITHGFMNRKRLEEYKPEIIVDSLSEFGSIFYVSLIWDEITDRANRLDHVIGFRLASEVFADKNRLERQSSNFDASSPMLTIGFVRGILVTVTYDEIPEFIKIRTAWKAEPAEVDEYNNR